MPRRQRVKKPRRHRRHRGVMAHRRGRQGYTGSRLIEKVYRYITHPQDQYIVGQQSSIPGSIAIKGGNITNPPLVIANTSAIVASKTGFTNYYDFGASIPFQLNNLENYLKFTTLYDNYRLERINIKVEYLSNSAQVQSTGMMPIVYAVVDRDDVGVPPNLPYIQGRQGFKTWDFGNKGKQTYIISIKPKVAANVFSNNGGTLIGFQQSQGMPWQDCVYPANQYYGLKMWFTNVALPGTTTVDTCFRFSYTYVLAFKGALNEY